MRYQVNLLADNIYDFFNVDDCGQIEADLFNFITTHPKSPMEVVINYCLNTAPYNDNQRAYALFFLGGVAEQMNKLKGE